MIKTKIRYYRTDLAHVPVKVWKLGRLVIWRKRLNKTEAKRVGV